MHGAHPLGDFAGNEPVGRLVGQHGRLGLEQGDVDMLAFTGGPGVQQRGEDGVGGVESGEQVGHGDPDLHWRAVRLAGDRHQPAHGLNHVVVAGAPGVRTGLAEACDRAIDQPGIEGGEARIVQAVLGEAADLEVLHQHLGPGGEGAHQGGPLRVGDVHRHRALVAVGREEIGGVAPAPVGLGDERRAPPAGFVTRARPLDLDHLGSKVGQRLGRPRSSQNPREVEHGDA